MNAHTEGHHLDTPALDFALASGGNKVEKMLAVLVDFGFLETHITPDGDCTYTPTEGMVDFLGLDAVGIGIENGCWIRFD